MINLVECKTELEAVGKVNRFKYEQERIFCPLIKTFCRTDCVSYSEPHTFKSYNGNWFAYNMFCSNTIINMPED
jgi:hypothetical protein